MRGRDRREDLNHHENFARMDAPDAPRAQTGREADLRLMADARLLAVCPLWSAPMAPRASNYSSTRRQQPPIRLATLARRRPLSLSLSIRSPRPAERCLLAGCGRHFSLPALVRSIVSLTRPTSLSPPPFTLSLSPSNSPFFLSPNQPADSDTFLPPLSPSCASRRLCLRYFCSACFDRVRYIAVKKL